MLIRASLLAMCSVVSTILLGCVSLTHAAPVSTRWLAVEPVAAEPSTEPLDGLVIVHVDMEGATDIADVLQRDAIDSLRESGLPLDLPGDAPLELTVGPDPGALGAYRIVVQHRGEPLEVQSCPCSGEELRVRVREMTVRAWEQARAADGKPEATAEPPAPASTPAEPPATTLPPKRWRGLWTSGLVAMTVGGSVVVGSIAGIIDAKRLGLNVPPVAFGATGAGLVLAAAGVPMFVIAERRRTHAIASFGPPGPGRGLVFSVRGRF